MFYAQQKNKLVFDVSRHGVHSKQRGLKVHTFRFTETKKPDITVIPEESEKYTNCMLKIKRLNLLTSCKSQQNIFFVIIS